MTLALDGPLTLNRYASGTGSLYKLLRYIQRYKQWHKDETKKVVHEKKKAGGRRRGAAGRHCTRACHVSDRTLASYGSRGLQRRNTFKTQSCNTHTYKLEYELLFRHPPRETRHAKIMPGPIADVVSRILHPMKQGKAVEAAKTDEVSAQSRHDTKSTWFTSRSGPPSDCLVMAPTWLPRTWNAPGHGDSKGFWRRHRPATWRFQRRRLAPLCPAACVHALWACARAHASPLPQGRRVYIFKRGHSAGTKDMKQLVSEGG